RRSLGYFRNLAVWSLRFYQGEAPRTIPARGFRAHGTAGLRRASLCTILPLRRSTETFGSRARCSTLHGSTLRMAGRSHHRCDCMSIMQCQSSRRWACQCGVLRI
ncbi:hypothetical protein T310_8681, partial [Rasamsonia emersonii CBS 393.64]